MLRSPSPAHSPPANQRSLAALDAGHLSINRRAEHRTKHYDACDAVIIVHGCFHHCPECCPGEQKCVVNGWPLTEALDGQNTAEGKCMRVPPEVAFVSTGV